MLKYTYLVLEYIVHCIIYTVRRTLYTVQCTLSTVHSELYRASCPIHNSILWSFISKTTVNMNKFSERKRRIPHSSMIRLKCEWYRCESGNEESKYLNLFFYFFTGFGQIYNWNLLFLNISLTWKVNMLNLIDDKTW